MKKLFILMVVVLFVVITGCSNGGGDNASSTAPPSSEKANKTTASANPATVVTQYVDLTEESRIKAADSAIAEVQARASNVYNRNMMNSISPNDCAAVFSAVNSSIGESLGDYTVAITSDCPSGFTITVTALKGKSLTTPKTGIWKFPEN